MLVVIIMVFITLMEDMKDLLNVVIVVILKCEKVLVWQSKASYINLD